MTRSDNAPFSPATAPRLGVWPLSSPPCPWKWGCSNTNSYKKPKLYFMHFFNSFTSIIIIIPHHHRAKWCDYLTAGYRVFWCTFTFDNVLLTLGSRGLLTLSPLCQKDTEHNETKPWWKWGPDVYISETLRHRPLNGRNPMGQFGNRI